MIKKLLFLIFVFFAFVSNAQNVVLIEENSDKWELFEEENPYSLFSLLKNNLGILGYYNLEGLNQEKVVELRTDGNEASLLRFVFPDTSGVPIVDSNGKDSIQTIDGLEYYVYPSPDTIYADLDNISVITIEFEGNSFNMENMTRLNCWKGYHGDDQLTRTFSADAKELLKLDAFKQVVKLGDTITNKLTNLNDPNSLWFTMKVNAIRDMTRQKEMADTAKMDIVIYNEQQNILPNPDEFYWNSVVLRLSEHVYKKGVIEEMQTFCEDDDPIEKMPFEILDSARDEKNNNYELIKNEMNSIHYVDYQPKSPLIESDPDSPNFGMGKIVYDENGKEMFMFPPSERVYFWLDYDDVEIYVTEDIVYNESVNYSYTKIEQVFMTKRIGNGAPKLISYFYMTDDLQPYFKSQPTKYIMNQKWYTLLNEAIGRKKSRYKLSKKCQKRKYLKRFKL